jgi:hypothetical protein
VITKKPLSAEVRTYAKEKKFAFPLISHLVGLVMQNQKKQGFDGLNDVKNQ